MTDEDLIAFALSLPEAVDSTHFGTRDFRVRGRIYLTLAGPDYCVLKLTPDQQQIALAMGRNYTLAVPGGWGAKGWTRLYHQLADEETVKALVQRAWQNAAPKSMALPGD
ncbi:MAG: MmcQ/YjbR family DNA-binding protein [Rhizobiaceae bacterium]|nr:MmcQ/YjbR family DNA-binding protein [Rhizobiaceae bacterium]